jgi:hypothetical protein
MNTPIERLQTTLADLISLRTPQAFGRKPNALPRSVID